MAARARATEPLTRALYQQWQNLGRPAAFFNPGLCQALVRNSQRLDTRTLSELMDLLERVAIFPRTLFAMLAALTDFGGGLADRVGRLFAQADEIEHAALETSRRPRGLARLAAPMSFGIARQLAPVRRFIVAAPSYLERHGCPRHPDDLSAHHCLGYAYRASRDVWRLSNKTGDSATVTPIGPLRVNNGDALIPTSLAGLAIAELPEFIAFDLLRTGQVEALLQDWSMAPVGLYFVTPTARARGAIVEALSSFLTERLSRPDWRVDPKSFTPSRGTASQPE